MAAITVYCSIAQLETVGMRAEALTKFTEDQKNVALATASGKVRGYLARFALPLVAIGMDLTEATAIIAAYMLLSTKGFAPDQNAADQNVRDRYLDTLKWLTLVAAGTVVPDGIVDSGSSAEVGVPSGAPRVVSASSRGYSTRGTGFDPGPFQGG